MRILNTMKQDEEEVKINASEIACLSDDKTSYETIDTVVANVFNDVSYDTETGALTLTKKDGTSTTLNLAVSSSGKVLTSGSYDSVTQSLILVFDDGSEISITLGDIVQTYSGTETSTITSTVADNSISCNLKTSSVTKDYLSAELQEELDSKQSSSTAYTFESYDTAQNGVG